MSSPSLQHELLTCPGFLHLHPHGYRPGPPFGHHHQNHHVHLVHLLRRKTESEIKLLWDSYYPVVVTWSWQTQEKTRDLALILTCINLLPDQYWQKFYQDTPRRQKKAPLMQSSPRILPATTEHFARSGLSNVSTRICNVAYYFIHWQCKNWNTTAPRPPPPRPKPPLGTLFSANSTLITCPRKSLPTSTNTTKHFTFLK